MAPRRPLRVVIFASTQTVAPISMSWLVVLVGGVLLLPGSPVLQGEATSSVQEAGSISSLQWTRSSPEPATGSPVGLVAIQPDSLDQKFGRANEVYGQGQYARALDLYRSLLKTGYESGPLYYNLGNTYVQVHQLGQAIRYYEKARRLQPNDPRVAHNLEQARRRAGVYPERLDAVSSRTLEGFVQGWPPFAIYGIGGLLFCGGLVAAVVWARPSGSQSSPLSVLCHPLVWGPIAGGLLLVSVAVGASYLQTLHQRAVVVTESASLRGAPRTDAVADSTLSEGRLVAVMTRRSQWHQVRVADGTIGWVPARSLGDV